MATKHLYLKGTIKWAKGLATKDPEYGTYNAQFYPDAASLEVFNSVNHGVDIKTDDEGVHFKIKRPHEGKFKNKNTGAEEIRVFGPPKVFQEINGVNVDLDPRTVGNGSKVTAKIEAYDAPRYKKVGTRLEAVRVEELIQFDPNETLGSDEVPF